MAMTVRCPACSSVKIRVKQIAWGTGEVYEWSRTREGDLEINDFDQPRDTDWEIDGEASRQFVCGNPRCSWEGSANHLVVELSPDANVEG